ncbi:hypothetical protein J2T49_005859 [Pseudomonas nitroreducens]|nr:hypothetical protein [Pseudomonas nitroreducens]MCP1689872.1 hypothetical protein [Pseudomonas nitroreducens]
MIGKKKGSLELPFFYRYSNYDCSQDSTTSAPN